MQHTKFGRTGLRVSKLCLGTMTFGLQCDQAQSNAIMDAAAEGGIDFFDAADVYPLGGSAATVGRTEEIIGDWLQGKRDEFVIATKCFGPMGPKPWNQGMSRKHIVEAIDGSLRRLKTDYIDVYQLHGFDPGTPIDEALEGLDAVVKAGKARYVGVSNWMGFRIARALGRSEARGLVRIDSVQPRYNLLFRTFERDMFPLCLEEGIAVIPYNPIAGGLLSGKHGGASTEPEAGTRFTIGTAAEIYTKRYWHEQEFATVEELKSLAADAGLPLVTLAVAWVAAHPAITSPIVGASRPEQLADSVKATEVTLDPDLKAKLDTVTREYRKGDAPR